MQKLQVLIDQLTKGRNIHISILDLVGVLDTSMTQVAFRNVIHSKRFCDVAKSTDKGYRTCLRCKRLANAKAVNEQSPFFGGCLYGLYEVAYPVRINKSVAAIVYVGNAVVDRAQTIARIKQTCRRTGVDPRELIGETDQCEVVTDANELFQIAELTADYLKLLYGKDPHPEQRMHWLVSLMKRHADDMYRTGISLKELAVTCRKNEKYLGRLFKKEMGMGFHDYCTQLRLREAEQRLLQSDEKVIDVAFACGFNNVSYFNRVFKAKHGVSPRAYRADRKHMDIDVAL